MYPLQGVRFSWDTARKMTHTKLKGNWSAGRQENFCLLLAPNLSFHYFTPPFSLATPELTEYLEEASSNLQTWIYLAKHYMKYAVEMCIF